jgi:hypothetical protein
MSLLDKILKSSLSQNSKDNYTNRVKYLQDVFDTTIDKIVEQASTYVPKFKKLWDSYKSQRAYVIAVLALFKYNASLKDKHTDSFKTWTKYYEELTAQLNKDIESNKPSEKQQEGYIPFDEFKKKREELPEGSTDRLLVAMYSLIPPMRADYNKIKIYHGKAPRGKTEPNHIVLGKNPHLVISEYKTANRYGTHEMDIPPELEADILDSLEKIPREWLFETRNGNPYTATEFTRYASRAFKRIFGKPITIGLVRHMYVNTLDFNKMTTGELENVAKSMKHSMDLQNRYRLIFDDKTKK